MRISNVKAELTGADILSIINEFVKVEGLTLTNITVDQDMTIEGKYNHGILVDFYGSLILENVREGKIYCRFSKFKLMKLGLFRMIRSFALKKFLSLLKINGIQSFKDKLIIDINTILQDIPFVRLDLKACYIKEDKICVDVDNLEVSIEGKFIEEEKIKEEIQEEIDLDSIEKTKDIYSEGRKKLEDKLPHKVKFAKDIIFALPDIVALIVRLLKDRRVSIKTKMSIAASLAYLTVKSDIIPDNLPFIGKIDDVAVIVFALNRIANDIDMKVIVENWEGKNDLLFTLKNSLSYLVNFTRANNVEKLYNLIGELSTL